MSFSRDQWTFTAFDRERDPQFFWLLIAFEAAFIVGLFLFRCLRYF
jgi:hypothetical protein